MNHIMEHALSAYYDIAHGESLAIITPRWMKHVTENEGLEEAWAPLFEKDIAEIFRASL